MENQVNVGDQDSPQIGQNSNNQLSVISKEKPNRKINMSVLFVPFLIIFFLITIFLIVVLNRSWRNKTENITTSLNKTLPTTQPSVSTQSPTLPSGTISQTEPNMLAEYNSFDDKYSLVFYEGEKNDIGTLIKCKFSLTDNTSNEKIDIKKLFPAELIRCDKGMGNFSSDLVQWAKYTVILNDSQEGKIELIDIQNQKTTSRQYNNSSFAFVGVDNNLNYWLYNDKRFKSGQSKFTLLDTNGKQITDKIINNESYSVRIVYDPINNGFLFIYDLLNNEETQNAIKRGENIGNGLYQYYFDFLGIDILKESNLLSTNPNPIFGRGCYEDNIEFQKGKIIIESNNGSCLQIDSKYYVSGKIILNVK